MSALLEALGEAPPLVAQAAPQLPVQFPSAVELGVAAAGMTLEPMDDDETFEVVEIGTAETKEKGDSLDDLMNTYLAAVQKIRKLDQQASLKPVDQPATNAVAAENGPAAETAPVVVPLEDTLLRLMKALNSNADGDTWKDKPQQEDLPIRFYGAPLPPGAAAASQLAAATISEGEETPEVSVETFRPQVGHSCDSTEALVAQYLQELRGGRAALDQQPQAQHHDGGVKADAPNPFDGQSLSSLLAALDNMT